MRPLNSYLIVSLALCFQARAADFYVSTFGNDAWSGRFADANVAKNDGPFRSLEGARDAIRRRRSNVRQQAVEPVTVFLRDGTYVQDKTFELGDQDGGSAGAPVTWRAYRDEKVRFVGGREITKWSVVDAGVIADRIQPSCRDKIRQADLRAAGVTNFGQMRRRGFGPSLQPSPLELFYGGRPMTVARWPNEGWAIIAAAPGGLKGATFICPQAPMERWKAADDLWVHGLWTYDWADSYERVVATDVEKKQFTTAPPYAAYGFTAGKRFYAVNLIEELDAPGEFYVDTKAGKIFFWPPGPLEGQETWVSVLEEPMVRLKNTQYVTLEGLTFECTRDKAVEILGGAHNLIDNCTIRNIGSLAIRIAIDPGHPVAGESANGVKGCEIYDCGEGGIVLEGGDRKTLTPGGSFATDNHIYRFQRTCLTYRMAVHVFGVGQRVAHNLMHDAPHTAVLIDGNDHIIEYNEFHHVCTETGDAGACYIGRDLTARGNIVRYNYFHDLHGVKGQKGFTDVMGVYLDDCTCGTTIFGNIFRNVSMAILVGGGRDNTIENNIFLDCPIAVFIDARATTWAAFWWNGKDNTLIDRLKAVNYSQPPYSERYPELKKILEDEPAQPKGNRIAHNLCSGGGKWLDLHTVQENMLNLEDNFVGPDAGFVDPARGDYRLRPGAPAAGVAFVPIPWERIGPPRRPFTHPDDK
jgi:parallel beta-helix repeat protein